MEPKFYEVDQGTPEWHELRRGIPTASRFKDILPSQNAKEKTTRTKYMHQLAGEIVTGDPMVTFSNMHIQRGTEQEPKARAEYEFQTDEVVKPIGFARLGRAGASPDGIVDQSFGGIEIKTRLADLHIKEAMFASGPPTANKAQVQGQLWVTGWEWIDLISYCPRLPLVVWRIERDEEYIHMLAEAHEEFINELDVVVDRIMNYGKAA